MSDVLMHKVLDLLSGMVSGSTDAVSPPGPPPPPPPPNMCDIARDAVPPTTNGNYVWNLADGVWSLQPA